LLPRLSAPAAAHFVDKKHIACVRRLLPFADCGSDGVHAVACRDLTPACVAPMHPFIPSCRVALLFLVRSKRGRAGEKGA
jgi:hypothetical protein